MTRWVARPDYAGLADLDVVDCQRNEETGEVVQFWAQRVDTWGRPCGTRMRWDRRVLELWYEPDVKRET